MLYSVFPSCSVYTASTGSFFDTQFDEISVSYNSLSLPLPPSLPPLPRTEHLDIFLFSAHHSTQWHSMSDVLFTSGRGVSDFSVLRCY